MTTAHSPAYLHGGLLALRALDGSGIDTMFTLSGGHIFPLLDAAHHLGWKILDVRHEQTAVFAAEGTAKVTRVPGLAALTAGPGVTNGVSAVTGAFLNGSPMLVLGGRAPHGRWGAGSLQELDHVPIMDSVTKLATTATETAGIVGLMKLAFAEAATPHRGPVFVDFPLDVIGGHANLPESEPATPTVTGIEPDPGEISRAAALIAGAERPVAVAGSDVYWSHGEHALVAFAEECRVPIFVNGLGRGTIPASHDLACSRARPLMKEADVVVVIGTPLDFRLSFGDYGSAHVVHVVDAPDRRSTHVTPAVTIVGDPRLVLEALAEAGAPTASHEEWIARVQAEEAGRRQAELAEVESDADPIHPARVYGELRRRLEPDAIVIGDGGDFVSYAGRLVDSQQPGTFLEPGPYGCLGTGVGYAIAARLARPDGQVAVCFGDGAFGFSGMDVDTLVRHHLPVVMVVGNNGIWGLEKHPMQFFYGYDVAADLQPSTRYDDVVRALGGAGETVTSPGEIGPALDRAFASGSPYLVNVITDPSIAYPRSSNLA